MKPIVGILVDPLVFARIKRGGAGHERISLYNRAARKLGLTPFYMTLDRVRAQSASGYLFQGGVYRLKERTIPRAIHNRTFARSAKSKKRMQLLKRSSTVFNGNNRNSKLKINRLLASHKGLRAFQPETIRYSGANLERAMRRHGALFLKPAHGSVGNGIMKLTKLSASWSLQGLKRNARALTGNKAKAAINQRIGGRAYLIQEAIPLARYKGCPYDLRVSVQRGATGKWQITGIVGKVAARGSHVTNVAKGGKVVKAETLLRTSGFKVNVMKRSVSAVSLRIADFLGRRLPQLADIGLDMGVDRHGGIQFIELNGRDQRYAFQEAGMAGTFYKAYETPLKYAKYCMRKKR